MIIADASSPVRIQPGTLITGRSDNSGLPDYARFSELERVEQSLNPYIGYNYMYHGSLDLRKVYALRGTDLYEYTVIRQIRTQNDTLWYVYLPISVKCYAENGFKTYLYLSGIDISCTDQMDLMIGGTVSLTTFCHDMLSGCNIDGVLPIVQTLTPTPYDAVITPEMPNTIANLLIDLGSSCLSYKQSAAAFLYYNYGEDFATIGKIFSYGRPNDIISEYACSPSPVLPLDKFNALKDMSACIFFGDMEAEAEQATIRRHPQVTYLDHSSHLYRDLEIDGLIECLNMEKCTDLVGKITLNQYSFEGFMFNSFTRSELLLVPQYACVMQESMRAYATNHPDNPIMEIDIEKTWRDELYLVLTMASSAKQTWFVNLALFHLYSPSILRVALTSQLSSMNK